MTAQLALRVEFDATQVRVVTDSALSEAARERFVESERTRLFATVPEDGGLGIAAAMSSEQRTRTEFTRDVATYADTVRSRWPVIVLIEHVEREQSKLVTILANDTANNFEDCRPGADVSLRFPVGPRSKPRRWRNC